MAIPRIIANAAAVANTLFPNKGRVRTPVHPAEVQLVEPGNEYPDMTADLLDRLHEEGERRLLEQHGRSTAKRFERY